MEKFPRISRFIIHGIIIKTNDITHKKFTKVLPGPGHVKITKVQYVCGEDFYKFMTGNESVVPSR